MRRSGKQREHESYSLYNSTSLKSSIFTQLYSFSFPIVRILIVIVSTVPGSKICIPDCIRVSMAISRLYISLKSPQRHGSKSNVLI